METKQEAGKEAPKPISGPLEIKHEIKPPEISDTLDKANKALAAAALAKQKQSQKHTWYCTECGSPHIQLYTDGEGSGHFSVDVVDGEAVHAKSGKPLEGREKRNHEKAARTGGSGCDQGQNKPAVAAMRREGKL